MDLIERQAAIEWCLEGLNNLPSAQPTYTDAEIQKMQDIEQSQIEKAFELGREDAKAEIIRCKGCAYHGQNKYEQDKDTYCFFHMMDRMLDDDYCSKAERRTDERSDKQTGGD